MTKIVELAWSDVHRGQFVRWSTPRFVKFGRVVSRKGQSLTVNFGGVDAKATVIPDARWYFVRGKENPDAEEHLVIVDELLPEVFRTAEPDDEVITVQEACELVLVDPKLVRRYIRRGKLGAVKDREGRWQVHRGHFLDFAVERGWL